MVRLTEEQRDLLTELNLLAVKEKDGKKSYTITSKFYTMWSQAEKQVMSEQGQFCVCGKQFTIQHNETCKGFTGKAVERVIILAKEKAKIPRRR
jgi:flagellar basal body rod protein FlgG